MARHAPSAVAAFLTDQSKPRCFLRKCMYSLDILIGKMSEFEARIKVNDYHIIVVVGI